MHWHVISEVGGEFTHNVTYNDLELASNVFHGLVHELFKDQYAHLGVTPKDVYHQLSHNPDFPIVADAGDWRLVIIVCTDCVNPLSN